MTRKDRTRRRAMATAHTRRKDNRLAASTGVRADDRRKVLREQRRANRPARPTSLPQPKGTPTPVPSTYVAPKPARREYRGSDNAKAKRAGSRAGGAMASEPRMHVPREFRPALLPGRRSRRERANIWLPATAVRVAA